MSDNFYSFDISAGWVVLVALLSLALAFLLYSKKGTPWHQNINILLGFLRFASLLLIGVLLLNPILRLSINEEDQPIFLIVNDNSSSVPLRMDAQKLSDISNEISDIQEEIGQQYAVATYDLSGKTDSLNYRLQKSNFYRIFDAFESTYDGKNVGGILFISDGIYNEGLSPAYLNYRYPIYTVGLGDTIPPRDISIKEVRHNRVAYQGNKFPIRLQIEQRGYNNQLLNVAVKEGGNLISSKNIRLSQSLNEVEFEMEAKKAGLLHLTINIPDMEGESTNENNKKDIFIEVIEGKEKILIISPAPHPDIKAIRQTLNETGNYETVLYIPGIHEPPKEKVYDVIVEYTPYQKPIRHSFKSSGKWLILGSRSNVDQINRLGYLDIDTKGYQKDLVRPSVNKSFRKFDLNENNLDRFNQVPPVEVYFGTYELTGLTDVLLYQKVGSVETTKPLMFFYDDGSQKLAVNIGTGIWQWKLQEAAVEGKSDLFNELVLKTIQFLSIRTDKKRFVATPRQSVYQEGDRIFIDTQVYDEIFERSYGNNITLSINTENGETRNYELVDSPINSAFNIGTLNQGIYQYQATVNSSNEQLVDKGEFLVESLQIEALDLTANHNLLKEMSQKSNGEFYHYSQLEQLEANLLKADFPSIIKTRESYFPLINSLWIIAVICALLFSEWFLRKYLGMY